ncbi:MAG TPA: hypothetical protein EYG18_07195 [Micavibrio sp.]|nr:hypothetical protein [Micavibrio sp.]HIL29038.1 hypothetical protein [Micavibrio sp.]
MCKFHKDVARDIATDPVTGDFNAGHYAVAMLAMGHFRMEQYMPEMYHADGFVPAELATESAQGALKAAFNRAAMRSCPHAMQRDYDKFMPMVRDAMAKTAAQFDLTHEGLNIAPGKITKDGYKATCCAQPDPTINGPFMDYAIVYLFDGYDDAEKTMATGKLTLLEESPSAQHEGIRMATEYFIAHDGILPALQQLFEDTVVKIFKDAPAAVAEGRGYQETKGCIMCHDDERRDAAAPKPPKNG